MSFVKRVINIKIYSTNGDTTKELSLKGYRAMLFLSNCAGYNAVAQLEMRIFGMNLSDMNAYSSQSSSLIQAENFNIAVSAGDEGGVISQIFSGNITASFIDFNSIPEVSFVISAVTGINFKLKQIPDSSWSGEVDVAAAIEKLAKSMNFGFVNNGVASKLTDQRVYGSTVDQIQQLASAAGVPVAFENDIVYIWPNTGVRDTNIIDVSPATGLVGFPTYTPYGFHIKTLFNPNLYFGRQVVLKSTIPKANGTFPIAVTSHELSTLAPNGPWFSEVDLTTIVDDQKGRYV